MKRSSHSLLRTSFLSFLALLSGYLFLFILSGKKAEARLEVRNLGQKPRGKKEGSVLLPTKRKETNNSKKTRVRFASNKRNPSLPLSYKPLDEIQSDLKRLALRHKGLIAIEKIGETTALKLPIWAAKVSDNATQREDEPRILFVGVHHAREPIGASICLELIKALVENYGRDKKLSDWVNSLEIWFVPVVNPDGYKYVFENNLRFPWWRKNLRDNDGDGFFNPLYDGVDLNRNYDFNWIEGGDGKPSSWFFRGSRPFSENETLAIMDLARRENFVLGVSYHSYGESILFPWGNFKPPPDLDLIMDIANEMATRMRRVSGRGKYSILPLNGRVGQSSIWMYGELRVIDYIVEVGTEYFPTDRDVPSIIRENIKGAKFLLERMLETGMKGHVFDSYTKRPLKADVNILEVSAQYVNPPTTDSHFGSFYRLLNPGTYTLEVSSDGYYSKVLRNVKVKNSDFVEMEIGLRRIRDFTSGGNR